MSRFEVSPISGLHFLWIEVTKKCNQACVHCYSNSDLGQPIDGQMTLNNWLKVIDDASGLGCKSIQFIGGEPTLYPHLITMIEFASEKNYDVIEVFTNATTLTSSLINAFAKHNVQVASSLYSCKAEVHDDITKNVGGFEKTVDSLKRLLSAKIPLRIGVIEMEQNKGHWQDTINYLNLLGIQRVRSDRSRNVGRRDLNQNRLQQQDTYIDGSASFNLKELCGQCWKGKLCVTTTGESFPCIFSRNVIVGNVLEQSLIEIINSTKLKNFRKVSKEYADKVLNNTSCQPDYSCGPEQDCSPNTYCGPYDQCGPYDRCSPCSPS